MLKFAIRTILPLLLAAMLSGCMVGYTNNTFSTFGYVKGDQYVVNTKDEMLAKFGQPLRTEKQANGREKYIYHGSLAWRGIIGIVILPVPLLVPVGFNDLYIEFEGDRRVGMMTEEMGSKFYGCMFPPILNGFCGAPM